MVDERQVLRQSHDQGVSRSLKLAVIAASELATCPVLVLPLSYTWVSYYIMPVIVDGHIALLSTIYISNRVTLDVVSTL